MEGKSHKTLNNYVYLNVYLFFYSMTVFLTIFLIAGQCYVP